MVEGQVFWEGVSKSSADAGLSRAASLTSHLNAPAAESLRPDEKSSRTPQMADLPSAWSCAIRRGRSLLHRARGTRDGRICVFVVAELPVVWDTMCRDCHCPAALAAPCPVFRAHLAEESSEVAHFDLNEPAGPAGRLTLASAEPTDGNLAITECVGSCDG